MCGALRRKNVSKHPSVHDDQHGSCCLVWMRRPRPRFMDTTDSSRFFKQNSFTLRNIFPQIPAGGSAVVGADELRCAPGLSQLAVRGCERQQSPQSRAVGRAAVFVEAERLAEQNSEDTELRAPETSGNLRLVVGAFGDHGRTGRSRPPRTISPLTHQQTDDPSPSGVFFRLTSSNWCAFDVHIPARECPRS